MFKPSSHNRAFKITFTEGFSRNTSSLLSDDAQILSQFMSELQSPFTQLPVKDAANVHGKWHNNANNLNSKEVRFHINNSNNTWEADTQNKRCISGDTPGYLPWKPHTPLPKGQNLTTPQRSIFSLEYGSFLEEFTNKTSCPIKFPNCLKAGTQNEWWKRTSILPAYFLCQK